MTIDRQQIAVGERFAFGSNWLDFLATVDEVTIDEAQRSLRQMLGMESLLGMKFLDIGCGSGLFSLAARRLGATVHSFDYDEQSVQAAVELRRRYLPGGGGWTIESGSALDAQYLASLGQFDVVYSWGVLHHTGAMWKALEHALTPLSDNGTLFIAIYNDQGVKSTVWRMIKQGYNKLPEAVRVPYVLVVGSPIVAGSVVRALLTRRSPSSWMKYRSTRGMSRWHDLVDWVGGYPFEVASADEIIQFFQKRGLTLLRKTTVGGKLGCNEFVFQRLG